MSDRGSPPPEADAERKQQEAEQRAKEIAEQAALPYKWTQTIGDADISILIDGKLRAKDLNIQLEKTRIVAGVKGQEPFIQVCLYHLAYCSVMHSRTWSDGSSGRLPFSYKVG